MACCPASLETTQASVIASRASCGPRVASQEFTHPTAKKRAFFIHHILRTKSAARVRLMDGFGARQRALEGGWYRQEDVRNLQRRAERLRAEGKLPNNVVNNSESLVASGSPYTSLLDVPSTVNSRRACEVPYAHTSSHLPGWASALLKHCRYRRIQTGLQLVKLAELLSTNYCTRQTRSARTQYMRSLFSADFTWLEHITQICIWC